ncbi:MAG: Rne/Rng family ribonuclease [Gemmatimonadales bacterium]|nr:MAG: Rne/Rng family ribonuclease [Gemmatimonadales bacterium]
MRREIIIDAAGAETRIAIVEDGRLVELMNERDDEERMVGDIYLGRVEAVLPGIQAAFVDIGTEKSAFLHVSDLQEEDDDEDGDDANGNGGNSSRRHRNYPPIQDQLDRGQELLVQVTKEPIGTKGPRVTSQISMPGRFIVFIPAGASVGVSRKIGDREERARLRELARGALGKKSGGLIVRTVGEELTKKALQDELSGLRKTWEKIQRRAKSMKAPAVVHQEAEMTSGLIRDLFSGTVDLLTVNTKELAHQAKSYLGRVSPELLDRVKLFEEDRPIFEAFGIEDEIQAAFRRRVELKSGGHIVIEHTEALVAIDVNTGSYTGRKDPAKTILRTNMDAAAEIARQLRLRDIGGIIVCDFIDMDDKGDRDKVLNEMRGHIGRDRARSKLFDISDLGLLQLSRQRVRPSLIQMMTQPCESCDGTGRVLSPDTVVRRIERTILRARSEGEKRALMIRVHPGVALYLLESEPKFLEDLGREVGFDLDVRDDPIMGRDEYRLLAAPADTDVTAKYAVH